MRIATAEWANPDQVEESYAFRDGMIWLGRSASENQSPIGYRDDRHVCLVSGSRGGKGTTSIVNNLILWPGSICVVDPKGENATITAARRGGGSKNSTGLGQSVRVLDPFKAAQMDDSLRGRFNPLDALDPENEETIDEAGRIADAIVVVRESNDPFWDESARAMVKGLILHVLTAPEYDGRRNLVTLRKLVTRGDWESVEALRSAGEKDIPPAHGLLWTALANNPDFDGLVAGIGDSFTNMLLNSPKQFESVLQVANRNTEFIDSPAMQRCLEASDFQIAELKTRPEGLSIYLCLPQRYMNTHYRWLRMMIALTVTEMEKVRGRPVTGYPILMVLDEFAGLKRMEVIENAVAQIASYGVKLLFALQSLEQLKAVYKDNWETFLANSGLKVFFNLEDHFSRDYVAKLIGETEVVREVRSGSDSTSESESTTRSTSRSKSESHGTSVSDGTSHSVNRGTSGGISKSKGKSWNWGESETLPWSPGLFFRHYGQNRTSGKSTSESLSVNTTKSQGWSEGQSEGVSHTTGTSQTTGTSVSETEGTTRGTSRSRTDGMSETIQKRALVTPDEIGQLFARVDDRRHFAYPGLALVVISGARPVALRRVNYYEDFQFMRLFDPHPDYPLVAPKELTVDSKEMEPSLEYYGLRIGSLLTKAGTFVGAGDEACAVAMKRTGVTAARIRMPRAGLVSQAGDGAGPLFTIQYYEDGADLVDPFAELKVFFEKVAQTMAAKRRELTDKLKLAHTGLGAFAVLAVLTLFVVLIVPSAGAVLTLIGLCIAAFWMGFKAVALSRELKAYGGLASGNHTRQIYKSASEGIVTPAAPIAEVAQEPIDKGAVAAPPRDLPPATALPQPAEATMADEAPIEPAVPRAAEAGPASGKLRKPVALVVFLLGFLLLVIVGRQAVIRYENQRAAERAVQKAKDDAQKARDKDAAEAFDRRFHERMKKLDEQNKLDEQHKQQATDKK